MTPQKRLGVMVAACLVLIQAMPLLASECYTLADILVTARGKDSSVCLTPGGTAVMESWDIFQAQDPSITHTLTQIPGVEKSSDSAWGSAVNIRGLGREQVVFLIDGTRVNTATDINARFGLINPNEIQRVEVLKGPISSLYGSGTMGGVINIITRKGTFSDQTRTSSTIGGSTGLNPQGFSAFGHTALNSKNFWIYAFGGRRDYDSYETGKGTVQDHSFFADDTLGLKSAVKWNPANLTQINIQYTKGNDIGIPGKGLALPAGPAITYPDTYRTLVSLTHHLTPESNVLSQSDLNLYYQKIERNVKMDFPKTSPMDTIKPTGIHKTFGAKWMNTVELDAHSLVAGLDTWSWAMDTFREKNFSSGLTGIDTPLADARQTSVGFFMEDDIQIFPSLILNLGGRIDYMKTKSDALYNWVIPPLPAMVPALMRDAQSSHDLSWNAHAGMTWQWVPHLSMTFLCATAFRSPDLMERYKYLAFSGGQIYGNPDLDPERSMFFEYGLHYNTQVLRVSAALYANFLNEMITEALVPGSATVYQMENLNKARLLGGELDVQYRPFGLWQLYANIAYTRGTNETDNTDLSFIPPLNGLAGMGYNKNSPGLWGDMNLTWAACQDKIASEETRTPGWATVNLKAGYRFLIGKTRHDLMLGIDNLLDKAYANHLSTSRGVELSEPGFNAYLAWKMTF